MRTKGSGLFTAVAAGATALAYAAYRHDINAARERIQTGQLHDSIEFAEAGNGPAVLVIHGAGGGFDQGLDLGHNLLGDDYRIIAPSRFGYLGTPVPADASAEAQADAHLRLLDALQLDSVAVLGVSAGAPSAMQLCLRHPERCSALVLLVPLAYAPQRIDIRAASPLFEPLINTVVTSDFVFWAATKVAHSAVLKTILGTPVEVYRDATPKERWKADRILRDILPISRRAAGIANDTAIATTLTRYPLETMQVPTLTIGAADCLYGTYDSALYTAEQISGAKFIGFAAGGHLLLGHDVEIRSEVTSFLAGAAAALACPQAVG